MHSGPSQCEGRYIIIIIIITIIITIIIIITTTTITTITRTTPIVHTLLTFVFCLRSLADCVSVLEKGRKQWRT